MKYVKRMQLMLVMLICLLLSAGCHHQKIEVNTAANGEKKISTEYLDEYGIHITKQGHFSETLYNASGKAMELPCTISMNEEITDQTNKKIVIEVSYDYSKIKDAAHWYWHTAFDRYTGQCFNITNLNLDDYEEVLCDSTIEIDGKSYYVSGTSESDEDFPIETFRFIIDAPMEYDGLVFQVGYFSDVEQQTEIIDDPEVNYINEKNTFEYTNYYFTLLDE